ncbi:uncharacterized protein LOC126108402 [Schistocerca cancellata]|uniref:uncharacterized protein LOC126108402 n=1 Tax=Schistocerca cancellata TaxID=274614 RepID=UPI00211885B4|nr:uncharacterized protein LOC126108402 [Schistocerca cancellata]
MEDNDAHYELSEFCGLSETWSPENLASMLKAFWRNLEMKNTEDFEKRREDKIPFMILSREVIDMVFCIGRRLNQTTEAQFITIEILDRFIISEIMAVWNWSRSTDSAKWERALSLVKKQFMLRLLCCVGIASKIEGSPGRVLKPKVLARYLSTNDRAITIRAVCLSEFHILRLIDYKPPLTSSLTYVNALCCLLSSLRPVPTALATPRVMTRLWEVSGRILRLVTANHHEVYDSLAEFARRNSGSNVSDEDLVAARCDRILLSVATVTLSALLVTAADADRLLLSGEVSPGSTALDTVLEVSAVTGIAHQDVEAAVAVLAHTTGLLGALLRRVISSI